MKSNTEVKIMFIGQIRGDCVLKTEPCESGNITHRFPIEGRHLSVVEFEITDGVATVTNVLAPTLRDYCQQKLQEWLVANPGDWSLKYVV